LALDPQTKPEIDELITFVPDVRRIAFRLVEAQAGVSEVPWASRVWRKWSAASMLRELCDRSGSDTGAIGTAPELFL
jgi:hypothetical protein